MLSIVFLIYFLFFTFFQSIGIYGGDAGDLVTAAYVGGLAHPPGYPLYTFLGYLLSHIPWGTVPWRVALISSVSSSMTLTLLWKLLHKLGVSKTFSFIATSILAFTYVFWLYSIVPEVFSLLLMFSVLLVSLAYSYYTDPHVKKLYALAFFFGLSLTHHHMILMIVPAILFILSKQWKELRAMSVAEFFSYIFIFALGLLPYMWAPIAAWRAAPVVWANPSTLENFVRLITRSDYGSFQSGASYGQAIQSRLLQMPFLFQMFINDFSYVSLPVAFLGIWGLWKKDKNTCIYFLLVVLFFGPAFFFYASYLLTTRFQIATAERFVLPFYLFVTVFIGYGMHTLYRLAVSFVRKRGRLQLRPLIMAALTALYLIIPLSLLYSNYPKLSILTYDRTGEKLGHDFLQSLEQNSIFMLKGDHAVFNTEYMHYVESERQDVALLHMTKFLRGDTQKQMKKYHPTIKNRFDSNPVLYMKQFVEDNYATFPIYASAPIEITPPEYTWVPIGLVYRLYKASDMPDYTYIKTASERLWSHYQDPLSGSLGLYPNLMQSNVTDYYRNAHMRTGIYALQKGKDFEIAASHFKSVIGLDPSYTYSYYFLAQTYVSANKCDEASKTLKSAADTSTSEPNSLYYIQSKYLLEKVCFKNDVEAEKWKKKLDHAQKQESILLEEL